MRRTCRAAPVAPRLSRRARRATPAAPRPFTLDDPATHGRIVAFAVSLGVLFGLSVVYCAVDAVTSKSRCVIFLI